MEETIDLTLHDDSPPPPARIRKLAVSAPPPSAAAARASSIATIDIEDSPPPLSLDDDSPTYLPTTVAAGAVRARGRPAPIAVDLEDEPDAESFDGSPFGATWMPTPPPAALAAAPTAAAVRRRLLAAAGTGPARAAVAATAPLLAAPAAAPIIRQRMGWATLLRVTIATEQAGMPPKELRVDWDALVAVSGWFERCLSEECREGRTGAINFNVDSWDGARGFQNCLFLVNRVPLFY